MKTKLIEFYNTENKYLRGILSIPLKKADKGVICLHGFERCSTTEKKFKSLADQLASVNIATLRFDFSGTGLSDGDFKFTTIEKQGSELLKAIEIFQEETNIKKINIVAHSLGACVLANQLNNISEQIEKIILLAPALNQKDLLRYWFVTNQIKKADPNQNISWNNYKEFLSESAFLKDCEKNDKTAKANYINSKYFQEAKDLDFSNSFKDSIIPILHIHGDKDFAVPIESLNISFQNQVLVTNGDHDLEKPLQLNQWLEQSISFIKKINYKI